MSLSKPVVPSTDMENQNKNQVLISIPTIYVSTDENGKDAITPNLKTIEYQKLLELASLGMKIPTQNKTDCIMMCDHLLENLIIANAPGDYENFIELLKVVVKCAVELDPTEEYYDLTLLPITFDRIRQYNSRECGLLDSAHDVEIEGCAFYSQLGSEDLILQVRQKMNDTDYNRIQYAMSSFEKMLMFERGYVLGSILRLINLVLIYIALDLNSQTVDGYCTNDLAAQFIGYLCDCLIRSRIVQAWRNDPNCASLLSDLKMNYDKESPVPKMVSLPDAKSRIQAFYTLTKKTPNIAHLLENFTYERYMNVLKDNVLNIEGKQYYRFNNEYTVKLFDLIPPLEEIQKATASITSTQ